MSGQHANSRKTQFKRGTVPHTWVPVGSVRVVEGVLERKFSNVPGAPHLRWRPVARLVWEGAHGPVPAGHVVAFKPGMHTTELDLITLDRVELLSRAELVRRNSIHHWPPELADVARLRGSLKRAINRKMKEEQEP